MTDRFDYDMSSLCMKQLASVQFSCSVLVCSCWLSIYLFIILFWFGYVHWHVFFCAKGLDDFQDCLLYVEVRLGIWFSPPWSVNHIKIVQHCQAKIFYSKPEILWKCDEGLPYIVSFIVVDFIFSNHVSELLLFVFVPLFYFFLLSFIITEIYLSTLVRIHCQNKSKDPIVCIFLSCLQLSGRNVL